MMKFTVYPAFLLIALLFWTSCKRNNLSEKNLITEEKSINNPCCDHLIMATIWFQQSAEARACYYQAFNHAKLLIENNQSKIQREKKYAVILDIDETILDNSPFEGKCIETGKSYSKDTWKKWTDNANARALPGALEFLNYLKENKIEAIYISNRRENEFDATLNNMAILGFPYADFEHILLRTDESSKVKRREAILKKYDVLLYIGDNLTDFNEIYEADLNISRNDLVDKHKNDFGTKFIILPNPMYGEWEKIIYKNDFSISEYEKDSLRKALIKTY